MSDNLLADYKAYYAVRAEKYANNPNFPNYYAAEKRLSDAMQSCAELGEFRDKIGDLNEKCAAALTKDQFIMEQKHFDKHQEPIRAQAAVNILQKVDSVSNVNDLITMVNEVLTKNGLEITCDEANRFFVYDWEYVDMADIYAQAEVPEKYKADMQRWADDTRKSIAEGAKSQEQHMDAFRPGWKLNPDIIMEPRHRRLLPYSDDQIREQIEKFKRIINA